MRGGIWVLNIFAALWGAAALWLTDHCWPWLLAPFAVSVAILYWASRQPGHAAPDNPGMGRLIGIWTAVEGVAIFIAANVLMNLQMPQEVICTIAVIVGLHFLPLARGIPVRLYYLTGLALVALGIVGWFVPVPQRALVVGFGSAGVLWLSAILLAARPNPDDSVPILT